MSATTTATVTDAGSTPAVLPRAGGVLKLIGSSDPTTPSDRDIAVSDDPLTNITLESEIPKKGKEGNSSAVLPSSGTKSDDTKKTAPITKPKPVTALSVDEFYNLAHVAATRALAQKDFKLALETAKRFSKEDVTGWLKSSERMYSAAGGWTAMANSYGANNGNEDQWSLGQHKIETNDEENNFIFATLVDGHSGPKTGQYTAKYLNNYLASCLTDTFKANNGLSRSSHKDVESILSKGCVLTDVSVSVPCTRADLLH